MWRQRLGGTVEARSGVDSLRLMVSANNTRLYRQGKHPHRVYVLDWDADIVAPLLSSIHSSLLPSHKKGLWPSRSITDQPFGCSHLTMNYLQLGKGGMVPASGLSHINGLAGFGPGVLNPAGKTPISVLALQPARWSSGLVRNWPRIWVANKKIRPPTSLGSEFAVGLFIMNCRFIIETNKMLKIWQIPTHLNGRKSSCAKVNLSLSTQQRSFLSLRRCKRWNFIIPPPPWT